MILPFYSKKVSSKVSIVKHPKNHHWSQLTKLENKISLFFWKRICCYWMFSSQTWSTEAIVTLAFHSSAVAWRLYIKTGSCIRRNSEKSMTSTVIIKTIHSPDKLLLVFCVWRWKFLLNSVYISVNRIARAHFDSYSIDDETTFPTFLQRQLPFPTMKLSQCNVNQIRYDEPSSNGVFKFLKSGEFRESAFDKLDIVSD